MPDDYFPKEFIPGDAATGSEEFTDEDFCADCGELLDDCTCDLEDDMEDAPPDDGPDESMDGDHETGLRDAGFGTDEDYGTFDSGLEE